MYRCSTFYNMKKKLILIILILLKFSIYVYGQDSLALKTPDEFGKEVLIAFKTNNFELFKSLLITEADHELILNKMKVSDSIKSIYRQQGIGAIKHLNAQAKQNFDDILNTAKLNNVNWEITELKEVKFYSKQKDEIERGDIIIYLKSGEISFKLILSNCHKNDQWFIMNKVSFTY